jgi:hypothetical protein
VCVQYGKYMCGVWSVECGVFCVIIHCGEYMCNVQRTPWSDSGDDRWSVGDRSVLCVVAVGLGLLLD